MALSGSVTTSAYTTSSGTTRTVVLDWTATQNVINNTSTITWTLKGGGTDSGYVVVSELRVTIDGTQQYYRSSSNHTNCFKGTSLASGSLTLSHNSDGTRSFAIKVDAGIYNWDINCTGSATATLTQLDRAAPTVTHSTSSITSSGFKISATSNVTADIWAYSLDGGSTYTNFSTTEGTSASITLSGLPANTSYSVMVRARKKTNQVYGYSTAASTKTLGATVIYSASTITADYPSVDVTMNLQVYDASFYHTLTIRTDSTIILTHSVGSLSAGSGNRTITLTSAERTALLEFMANIKSFTATLVITTYTDSSCSTQVGAGTGTSCTCQTTSENSAPTFTGFTYADTRTAISDVVGDDQILVQSYSYLQVVCAAGAAKNGASISSYSASIGSASKTSTSTTINIGTISSYGTMTLTVTCVDSRGYSASISKAITVLKYEKPKLTSYTLRRKNEVEALVQLSFSGNFSAIKADGSTNTNSLKFAGYYYKKTSEDSYGSWNSVLSQVSVSGTTFSFSTEELLELDADTSYDFHIIIRDQLDAYTTYDLYLVLPQGTPIIALRKRNSSYSYPRVGINNPNPKFPLDVGGSIAMNGYLVLGYVKDLSSENFNTIKEGIYYYSGSGCSNTPASSSGFLEAITNGTAILQRYTTLAGTVYCRGYDGSAWTSWA